MVQLINAQVGSLFSIVQVFWVEHKMITPGNSINPANVILSNRDIVEMPGLLPLLTRDCGMKTFSFHFRFFMST